MPAALALVLAAAVPAAADGAAASDLLAGVQRWLDGTRDLRAEFRQTLASGALGDGIRESGRLFLARPGRMRWDYVQPEPKVAIVDGDRTMLYLADQREMYLGRLGDGSDLLPVLLAGEGRLDDVFEIVSGGRPEAGIVRLELRPRNAVDGFERLEVVAREPDFEIGAVAILDAAGNRVLYEFTKVRRNRGIPDGVFGFEAPPGTAVSGSE